MNRFTLLVFAASAALAAFAGGARHNRSQLLRRGPRGGRAVVTASIGGAEEMRPRRAWMAAAKPQRREGAARVS